MRIVLVSFNNIIFLLLLSYYGNASADIILYTNKSTFLSESGAVDASGPLPDLGLNNHFSTLTVGAVTFEGPINAFDPSEWTWLWCMNP